MIYTDRFVCVHEPKTGGTFVSSVLFRVFGARWDALARLRCALGRDVVAASPKYGTFVFDNKKHGGCNDVRPEHRGKPILASVRNPYDLYVSQFEFGWWKRREFHAYYRAVPRFHERFPAFPKLTFAEYMELAEAAFRRLPPEGPGGRGPGLYTEQFVRFYFRDPETTLARLDDEYASSGACRADMHDVRFVRTHRLNVELHGFLLGMGFDPADVDFIPGLGRILPQGKGRPEGQRWESYYTPELKRSVRERDALVFTLFPEFDV